jgi:hypothetical protein
MPLEGRPLLAVLPTLLDLTSSLTSLTYGQQEVLTATVTTSPPSAIAPTGGTVTFFEALNGYALGALGSTALSNGTASFETTDLFPGERRDWTDTETL